MKRLTKAERERIQHGEEMDMLTGVVEIGGDFENMAHVYAITPVRLPDGSDAGFGCLMQINGRMYEITDGMTGIAADTARCLRQFVADLEAAAARIDARLAEIESVDWTERVRRQGPVGAWPGMLPLPALADAV